MVPLPAPRRAGNSCNQPDNSEKQSTDSHSSTFRSPARVRSPKLRGRCLLRASLDGREVGIVSLSHAMRAHMYFILIVQDVKLVERRCHNEAVSYTHLRAHETVL